MMLRRLTQLFVGLALYGVSLALMVRANLGLNPWNVFHQGVSLHLGWSIGTVVNITGAFLLLLWLPLRQRPGIGTVSNILVIGFTVDATLAILPATDLLSARLILLTCGILLNALATATYVGAGLGPGPRDGLMTGLAARTGWSIRSVRMGIELSVLVVGIYLGGTFGLGTLAYALLIGPLVQPLLRRLTIPPAARVQPTGY